MGKAGEGWGALIHTGAQVLWDGTFPGRRKLNLPMLDFSFIWLVFVAGNNFYFIFIIIIFG